MLEGSACSVRVHSSVEMKFVLSVRALIHSWPVYKAQVSEPTNPTVAKGFQVFDQRDKPFVSQAYVLSQTPTGNEPGHQ